MSAIIAWRLVITDLKQKIKWKQSKLVYYFFKFIGLAPFAVENDRLHPPTRQDLLYHVGMTVAHLLLTVVGTYSGFSRLMTTGYSSEGQFWGAARYLTSLPATVLTLAITILSHKKTIKLVNRLCDMNNELDALSVDENPRKMFNNAVSTTVVANTFIVAMCVALCLFEPNWPIITSIAYAVGTWFNLNALLPYVQVLFCIRQRFEKLNGRLSKLFIQPRDDFEASATRKNDDRVSSQSLTERQVIRRIKVLHLELVELMDQTSDLYGVQILLESLRFLCTIVTNSEFVYSIILLGTSPGCGPEVFGLIVLPNIWCPLIKIAIVTSEMLMIVYASARTSEEGNSTRTVLNETWNESMLPELNDEFFMFSTQLAGKPVAVSIFGVLNLDYSYLYKIFSAVVTYLVVMVQLSLKTINVTIWKELQTHGCVSSD